MHLVARARASTISKLFLGLVVKVEQNCERRLKLLLRANAYSEPYEDGQEEEKEQEQKDAQVELEVRLLMQQKASSKQKLQLASRQRHYVALKTGQASTLAEN